MRCRKTEQFGALEGLPDGIPLSLRPALLIEEFDEALANSAGFQSLVVRIFN